jgi:Flp pilus assembly protein TadG
LVEFAILAPALFLIMLGTAQFGLTMNQYVMLWNGVGAGAMQFAVIAGPTSTMPATVAWKAVTKNTPGLTTGGSCTTSSLCVTLTVSGTPCATNVATTPTAAQDLACYNALNGAAGTPAVVTATYPCNLTVMGTNFLPGCQLKAQITELVQ